jgi:4-aminobutyrate aminotransferase-like enzyme
MAVLNTNTRYLHENIVRYAERLCALLPPPLSVCFFVNSGSEANDLALRLARTYTGQQDVIVVKAAYHGHLTSLIDLSPYKFDGPGGSGQPAYVRQVTLPDPYRGPYRSGEEKIGEKYAWQVQKTVEQMQAEGRGVAAFFCESLPSVGGQIVLPDNYLRTAYRYIRQAGGVCVADEVQVGFGRVGPDFWGFALQGVVPDIVTLGKPMGNGYPLAAVVTTPEIGAAFKTGMEYFNTFAGGPVAGAAGLAVLEVLEREDLPAHALRVGNYLKEELTALMSDYPLIGDVRGAGLFLGLELVLDQHTLTPAPAQATYIANRMKDYGILLGTDGPFHNVIKIRPPLVFNEENAAFLVQTLTKILQEDFVVL